VGYLPAKMGVTSKIGLFTCNDWFQPNKNRGWSRQKRESEQFWGKAIVIRWKPIIPCPAHDFWIYFAWMGGMNIHNSQVFWKTRLPSSSNWPRILRIHASSQSYDPFPGIAAGIHWIWLVLILLTRLTTINLELHELHELHAHVMCHGQSWVAYP